MRILVGALLLSLLNPAAAPAERGGDAWGVFDIGTDPPRSFEALRDLGVGWTRMQLPMGERDPETYRKILAQGYGLWITLYHRDPTNVADPRALARTPRGGFPPADAARYQELVRRTIRPLVSEIRARGERPEDRLVVQIGNEVLPSDVAGGDRPQRFWHGTSVEYLRTLSLAYDAVKSVDSGIPVAMAGFASETLESAANPQPPRARGASQVRGASQASARGRAGAAWAERMLREGRYDWADVHLYHRVDSIPAKIAWVRARTSRPIAATEMGGPDPASGDRYSEAAHAEDLPRRIRAAREAGVARVFWSHLVENPNAEDRFRPMGLLERGTYRRKPAFEAYRRLIAGP